MILILSTTRIEGLEGTYATPNLIGPADLAHAKIVYTDSERVIDLAKKFDVEVRDFPKHPPTGSEGDKTPQNPPSPKKEEVTEADVEIGDVLTPIGEEAPKETTAEEDVRAGMSDEDVMAKHGISKRKLNAIIKKIQTKK